MRYSIHGQGLGCGKLTLSGAEVEHAFSNVIKNVIQSCNKLIGPPRIGHLLLVGGLGESPCVQNSNQRLCQ